MLRFTKGEENALGGKVVGNAEARLGPKAWSRSMGKYLWREEWILKGEE